jgi:hypothetical protein
MLVFNFGEQRHLGQRGKDAQPDTAKLEGSSEGYDGQNLT